MFCRPSRVTEPTLKAAGGGEKEKEQTVVVEQDQLKVLGLYKISRDFRF